jgi:hypothetical protein
MAWISAQLNAEAYTFSLRRLGWSRRRACTRRREGGGAEKGILRRRLAERPEAACSPLLGNIYLHHVLDDMPVKRLLDMLGKPLGQCGFKCHPIKTRFVDLLLALDLSPVCSA